MKFIIPENIRINQNIIDEQRYKMKDSFATTEQVSERLADLGKNMSITTEQVLKNFSPKYYE